MHEVAIIGAGPAGYVAAIRSAQLGKDTVLIEEENLGGICLNKGCIPTKTLLASTELLSKIKNASSFGINTGSVSFDFTKMMQRKNDVVLKLREGIAYLLQARKISLLRGHARLINSTRISLDNKEIDAKNIIIAAGSRPLELPNINFDSRDILSSNDLLEINAPPESLVIVGGGVIGCEFATIFAELGTKVTVLEMTAQLIPGEDREVAKALEVSLKKKGIDIFTASSVQSAVKQEKGLCVTTSDGKKLYASKVLLSVGRKANLENMGLEEAGVATDGKFVKVNNRLETSTPNIYAAGDITGGYLLAHAASYEGVVAAENISGIKKQADYFCVPSCVYTEPGVASVGINEDKAKQQNLDYSSAKFPFKALGRAHATGDTEGFVKLIVNKKTQELLGCQIIGPHASDLIAEAALAIGASLKVKDLAETIHAHPTFSESIMETAHKIYGSPIHML
ncbi:MAG: dihydrolipoyl dehydrogenase [Candidatus Omnitrophota bacterium]